MYGEPHPGNLISTRTGPLLIDFEKCCRGPIEFDLAHAPDNVGDTTQVPITSCSGIAGFSCWR